MTPADRMALMLEAIFRRSTPVGNAATTWWNVAIPDEWKKETMQAIKEFREATNQ